METSTTNRFLAMTHSYFSLHPTLAIHEVMKTSIFNSLIALTCFLVLLDRSSQSWGFEEIERVCCTGTACNFPSRNHHSADCFWLLPQILSSYLQSKVYALWWQNCSSFHQHTNGDEIRMFSIKFLISPIL